MGAVDPERVRDALASLIVQARALEIDGGMVVHPVSGRPLRRLRVVSGSHPRPGTVYDATERRLAGGVDDGTPLRVGGRAIEAGDPAAGRFRDGAMSGLRESTSQLELIADDRRRVELAATPERGGRAVVTIADPARPTAVSFSFSAPGGASWWTRGDVTSECRVDLAQLSDPTPSRRAPITGRARHRRFAARADVNIETTGEGRLLHIDVVARGRGAVRPVVAVFGVLFGWLIRRSLAESFAEWEADGAPLVARLNQPGDPQQLASAWLLDLLAPFVDEAPLRS